MWSAMSDRRRNAGASGYPKSALSSEHEISADGDFPFLSKSYRRFELAEKLREIAAD